jgi:hypothetical protein
MSCQNKLKQITLATINMADTNGGKLPLYGSFSYYPNLLGNSDYNGYGGLFFFILPYMEQNNLYQASLMAPGQKDVAGYTNKTGHYLYTLWADPYWSNGDGSLNFYVCPSDSTTAGWTGVAISYGYNQALIRSSISKGLTYPSSITDGTSNTVFFSEKIFYCNGTNPFGQSPYNELREGDNAFFNGVDRGGFPTGAADYPQFSPSPSVCNPVYPNALHGPVINVSLCDGSGRAVSSGVSPTTWGYALSPQGGEVLGSDW